MDMTSPGGAPIRTVIVGRTKFTSVVRGVATVTKAIITSSVATEEGRRMDMIRMDAVPTRTATAALTVPMCVETSC